MKDSSDVPRAPHGDTFLTSTKGRWAQGGLLFLFVMGLIASSLALIGPVGTIPDQARIWVSVVAIGCLGGLVVGWAASGFSGYEQYVGRRIMLRTGGRRPPAWLGWLACAVLVTGVVAMASGIRSTSLAVAVALAAVAVMVVVLARKLAVFAALSIMGIALGVAALMVVQSVATGFQHEFERRVLGVYAHINVTRAFGVSEYRRFEAYLRTVDGVQGASPFVYHTMALARTGTSSNDGARGAAVMVKGIDPRTAHEVIDLEEHLQRESERPVEIAALVSSLELQPVPDREDVRLPAVVADTSDPRGSDWYDAAMERWRTLPAMAKYKRHRGDIGQTDWPAPMELDERVAADALPTAFIGFALARELALGIGDDIMLVDPGATLEIGQAPMFRRYRIAGIFRAGFQEYDTQLVYVHIKELQWFKYRGKDYVSGVDLRLDDPYEARSVAAVLKQTIGEEDNSIIEWQTLNQNLFQSIQTQKSILTVILSLVSTVAGFNVLAALWTMVVRRTSDIAILGSMGASQSGVARIFQLSGMILGALGCFFGLGLGTVLCTIVQLYGYTLDPEVYFIEHLPVEISFTQLTAVVGMTMAISFIATVPPSLRASQLRPVDGLRFK